MKRIFTENVGLKFVAVTLAVLLELYFYSPDNSVEAVIAGGIEFEGLPPSMTVVSPPGGAAGMTVRFRVRGPGPFVDEVRQASHTFRIVVPPDLPTIFTTVLSPSQLKLPPHVDVLEIEPAELSVQLDKIIRKKLLVVVQKIGVPAEGRRVTETVTPDNVTAEGPKGELEGISIVQTQPIDISGMQEGKQLTAELVHKGPGTRLSETVVTINFKVSEMSNERRLTSLRVSLKGNDGRAVSLTPSTVDLIVTGKKPQLMAVASADAAVSVDVSRYPPGQHEVTPTVRLPDGIELVQILPEKVLLMVTTDGKALRH